MINRQSDYDAADLERLRPWLDFVKRMQAVSSTGMNRILEVCIIIDGDGKPILWSEPRMSVLNPKYQSTSTLDVLAAS
jgi:hypothetical protein